MVDEPILEEQPLLPQEPAARLAPATGGDRIVTIDVLRGVAVLGILLMNIYYFALPEQAYSNPVVYGGAHGANLVLWLVSHLLFEQKFMTLFSMLFGAGLVLMGERAEQRGVAFRGVYYRRIFWLWVIGLLHGYLLWSGDILYLYAFCGVFLYLFRRRRPRTLLVTGAVLILIGVGVGFGLQAGLGYVRDTARQAEELLDAGETLSDTQESLRDSWQGMRSQYEPTEEDVRESLDRMRGGYLEILSHRASRLIGEQIFIPLLLGLWSVMGIMVVGMGLMKLGVFAGLRSPTFYRRCMAWGYGAGIPLLALSAVQRMRGDFDELDHVGQVMSFHWGASLLVAMGHLGLVLTWARSERLQALKRRMAAVGRMALTNYLMQSVLGTLLFYGYGLGLFGHIPRFALPGVVAVIWCLQLVWSSWWLSRHRFGPAEWVWRNLTYGRGVPLRREADSPTIAGP